MRSSYWIRMPGRFGRSGLRRIQRRVSRFARLIEILYLLAMFALADIPALPFALNRFIPQGNLYDARTLCKSAA